MKGLCPYMFDNPRRDQRLSDFLIDSQPHVEFSRAFRPANLRELIAFDVCPRTSVSARSVNKRRILPVILRANFVCGALEESKIKTMQTKRRPCKTHRDRVPVVASIVEWWVNVERSSAQIGQPGSVPGSLGRACIQSSGAHTHAGEHKVDTVRPKGHPRVPAGYPQVELGKRLISTALESESTPVRKCSTAIVAASRLVVLPPRLLGRLQLLSCVIIEDGGTRIFFCTGSCYLEKVPVAFNIHSSQYGSDDSMFEAVPCLLPLRFTLFPSLLHAPSILPRRASYLHRSGLLSMKELRLLLSRGCTDIVES
jgi:hypothetical protein